MKHYRVIMIMIMLKSTDFSFLIDEPFTVCDPGAWLYTTAHTYNSCQPDGNSVEENRILNRIYSQL